MDCEVHWIGCQLAEIAEKMVQPPGWEIANAAIGAFAALGTISIAVMNYLLIRRQHVLAQEAKAEALARSRLSFGVLLSRRVGEIVSTPPAGRPGANERLLSSELIERLPKELPLTDTALPFDLDEFLYELDWSTPKGVIFLKENIVLVLQTISHWTQSPSLGEATFNVLKATYRATSETP